MVALAVIVARTFSCASTLNFALPLDMVSCGTPADFASTITELLLVRRPSALVTDSAKLYVTPAAIVFAGIVKTEPVCAATTDEKLHGEPKPLVDAMVHAQENDSKVRPGAKSSSYDSDPSMTNGWSTGTCRLAAPPLPRI